MATATKEFLSASSNGAPVLVAATATAGTTIHTAPSGTTTKDEVWLYASNTSTSAVKLTLEWGGTTAGFLIEQTIPAESGLTQIAPGLPVNNSVSIAAFAGTTNVVNLIGFVNRITN